MKYYTTGDIAALLGVSRSTVSNWLARGYVSQGKLPTPVITTIGGMHVWDETQAAQIREDYIERKKLEDELSKLKSQMKVLKSKLSS